MKFQTENLGIMGTGSNMYTRIIRHSSGKYYANTYGPRPAKNWCFDPAPGETKLAASHTEYTFRALCEAPNGVIYIGTSYGALVYRYDPKTGELRDLGAPCKEGGMTVSEMICTRDGEIIGSRGIALFRLNWQDDTFEPFGMVPGNDRTSNVGYPSSPVIRCLQERVVSADQVINIIF